jgi:hypothetical protein
MRVNIEESVWTDQRFMNLCIEMNMRDYEAVGVMAKIWYHCQKNGTDTLSYKILFALIKKNKLILGLEGVGLLEKISDNFRVVGMKTRLEELAEFKNKRSEAGRLGGINSGEKRKQTASKGEAHASAQTKQTVKQNEASMSMSGSMSRSGSKGIQKEDMSETVVPPPSAAAPEGNAPSEYEWPNNVHSGSELIEAEVFDEKPKPARKPKPKPQVSEADDNLGKRWYSWTANLAPHINATPASFSVGIFETKLALARSVPNGDLDALLEALFAFIQKDTFWGKNCLSPCGLLAKSANGLRKVDNVIKDMRKGEFREKQKSLMPEGETDWSKFI